MQNQNSKFLSGIIDWFRLGEPFIWVNAAAVAVSIIAVIGLLILLTVKGFGHFWPSSVMQASYMLPNGEVKAVLGEMVSTEQVPTKQIIDSGILLETDEEITSRSLIKMGNRDVTGADFGWFIQSLLTNTTFPEDALTIERREWGNFYGFLSSVKQDGKEVANVKQNKQAAHKELAERIERASALFKKIHTIEKDDIGAINYGVERLRLRSRELELDSPSAARLAKEELKIKEERVELDAKYATYQAELSELYAQISRDSLVATTVDGVQVEIDFAAVVRAIRPNTMSLPAKIGAYIGKLWEFLTDEPREANTEGGIFPAIFGTVMMVLLMSVMVTPFGVVAAVYLREYATQGVLTRMIRIAVNNLAGVPSIVYGVFGLGFFIYFLGAEIDQLFFKPALPAPTFGTPGLLWASLTLALLTLPVVIVATEEGLARIPRNVREGSLALGATKAETLWRVVLPMASPAMMTGLILAVARAAGEVAPLMLVGVVKLAPSLPLDGNYPYLHLDQKFMHLGFHIYDVGFQSPNVEAARPLVYATAFLLVVIIALLNFSAVALRNHLREKYKSLEV